MKEGVGSVKVLKNLFTIAQLPEGCVKKYDTSSSPGFSRWEKDFFEIS